MQRADSLGGLMQKCTGESVPCVAGEESPLGFRESNQSVPEEINLNIHWKDWCWGSNILATWHEEPTHWKRPWCWERLRAGGEEDDNVEWHHRFNGHVFQQFQDTVKDREAWRAAVPGATKSQTGLSDWTTTWSIQIWIRNIIFQYFFIMWLLWIKLFWILCSKWILQMNTKY